MTKPFILGLRPSIPEMAFQDTGKLFELVGRNTGNLAFQAAVDSHFGGRLPVYSPHLQPQVINSKLSETRWIGIIPAANHLGPRVDRARMAATFSQLDCKIVMVGLGAQSDISGTIPVVPDGTLAWIREIVARSPGDGPNIGMRGPFSKKVMEHYGFGSHAVVLGCPSLFLNPAPDLGKRIAARNRPIRRVAVAAADPLRDDLKKIEQCLAEIVTETHGSYVGQHPLPMIQLTRGEASEIAPGVLRQYRDGIFPGMDLDEFIQWTERHGNVFFDIPNWLEHYRRFDFVISTRIHGTALALQAGVPAVCIVSDSRTLELCQTMLIPYVLASDVAGGVTREMLPKLFAQFDAEAFDANRRMLARRYVDFLESNELSPVSWLKDLAAPGERVTN